MGASPIYKPPPDCCRQTTSPHFLLGLMRSICLKNSLYHHFTSHSKDSQMASSTKGQRRNHSTKWKSSGASIMGRARRMLLRKDRPRFDLGLGVERILRRDCAPPFTPRGREVARTAKVRKSKAATLGARIIRNWHALVWPCPTSKQ